MLDTKIYDYIDSLQAINNPLEKLEKILKGCIEFFPFKRASIFAYSPLNYYGEGIMQIDHGRVTSMSYIREDVRKIPPIYFSLKNNQPHLIKVDPNGQNFPLRYIQNFQLSSLLIVPISYKKSVIGSVLIDHYNENESLEKYDSTMLYHYFQVAAEALYPASSPQKILSRREREVLQRLSYGYSLKEMADKMGISEYTVRDYLTSVNRKLGTRHRAEAVGVAMRKGLIR